MGGCAQSILDTAADKFVVEANTPEVRVYRGLFIIGGLANMGAIHISDSDVALSMLVEIKRMAGDIEAAGEFAFDSSATRFYTDVPFVYFAKSAVRAARISLPLKEFRDLADKGISAVGTGNPARLAVATARFLVRNADFLVLTSRLRKSAQRHFSQLEEKKVDPSNGNITWVLAAGRPNADDRTALEKVLNIACKRLAALATRSELTTKNPGELVKKYCSDPIVGKLGVR